MVETNNCLAARCRGVVKSYGSGDAKVAALRGVDLDVRQGELLMVVGPSGCGKTTLISVIGAILGHDSGECMALGRDVQRMSSDRNAPDFVAHRLGSCSRSSICCRRFRPPKMWPYHC